MIQLSKTEEPEVLKNNKKVWTQELLAAIAMGNKEEVAKKSKRYNHPQVKSALKLETKEKCAYCEAKVTDVAHGDIEHVTPKSKDSSLTFEWNNLTFACQICNQNKLDKEGIFDPYTEDPANHFIFVGSFVKGRSNRGAFTVRALCLNRTSLIESRQREISRYAEQLEKIHLVADINLRKLILGELLDELATGKPEFIATCKEIVEQHRRTMF